MNIQSNTSFYIQKVTSYSNPTIVRNFGVTQPRQDTFEKETINPVFCGKKSDKKEQKKIEEILKNIDGLHDPYSDIIMLPKNKFRTFQRRLEKKHDASSTVGLLYRYKQHMFESDQKMLKILKKNSKNVYTDDYGNIITTDFHVILNDLKPEAKVKLINAQLNVLDSIRDISEKKLPKHSQKEVESYLTILEKDVYLDRFRIKQSKDLLRRLYDEIEEKDVVDEIMKETRNFPNSATSTDAFIVKHADKSHHQIAELLLSPATISIEHIKPSSENGEDKGANYLAASKRMNNLRCSMPMDEFIDMFPDIPDCTQRYMDDLITRINRGGLSDVALTVFDVKDSLYKESKGKIDVDISAIKPDVISTIEGFKEKLNSLITTFNKQKN